MNLDSLPIEVLSVRDLGLSSQVEFRLSGENQFDALKLVLDALPVNGEVCVPDPEVGDCYREVRRTPGGYELKRGCHGAAGTWRSAQMGEPFEWLKYGSISGEALRTGCQLIIPRGSR